MKIETIKKEFVCENIDRFIQIGCDADIRPWGVENYMMDVPGKWVYSFAAIIDQRLIGYVFASRRAKDSLHIHHIALAGPFRGAGYGVVLLDELQYRALKADAKFVTLKVNSRLTRLCNYYRKHNFQYLSHEGEYEFLSRPVRAK